MIELVLAAVVIGLIVLFVFKNRPRRDYAALTGEAMSLAVENARSARELDRMWEAWERRGYAKDGMLYASILAKKSVLGARLSARDTERILDAAEARESAHHLPPVTGGTKVR